MIQSASYDILDSYDRINSVLGQFYDPRRAYEKKLHTIGNHLLNIKKNNRLRSQGDIQLLCEQVESHIDVTLRHGRPLSESEREVVIQNCEELRLQIIALMLLGTVPNRSRQNGSNRHPVDTLLDDGPDSSPIGPICHGMGGITSATVGDDIVVLFPRVRSAEQCVDIITELLNIFERTSADANWVIDFSGVDNLPVMLLGSILAYQKKLAARKRNIYFAWVQPSLLPRDAMKSFIRLFKLRNVGGHLFSQKTMVG